MFTKKLIKGLLVNTKNANTFTGKQGKESLDILAKNLSRILTIRESKSEGGTSETVKIKDLIFASTGVIGEEFPVEKIKESLPNLVEKLKSNHNKLYWLKIASAMMTTDTKPKLAYEEVIVGEFSPKVIAINRIKSLSNKYVLTDYIDERLIYWEYQEPYDLVKKQLLE